MSNKNIRWGAAIGGAVLAEILTIAAAFLWVAIYSYLVNPGQPVAVYEQHAQVSAPWVSILAGFFVFYVVCRWIARSVATAIVLYAIYLVLDVAFIMLATGGVFPTELLALIGASYLSKLVACWLGGLHGSRNQT